MQTFGIRAALPADAPVIAANNAAMALETEGITLAPERAAAGVASCLADPAKGFYLLASDPISGEVVGQLLVTFEWSDWRCGVFWWVQSVYVAPAHRRRGIYRALYAEVLARAEGAPGVVGVRLYVHSDNATAQATYLSLGMEEAPYRLFEVDFVVSR